MVKVRIFKLLQKRERLKLFKVLSASVLGLILEILAMIVFLTLTSFLVAKAGGVR
jgi:hypothetical protein